jgi:hypothetical protein
MGWLLFGYVAINGLLLSVYFDNEKQFGGEALLMFNLPVVFGAVIFYLIARFTSNR